MPRKLEGRLSYPVAPAPNPRITQGTRNTYRARVESEASGADRWNEERRSGRPETNIVTHNRKKRFARISGVFTEKKEGYLHVG